MDSSILDIVVVGTGAYVCGKSEREFGTILPALFVYSLWVPSKGFAIKNRIFMAFVYTVKIIIEKRKF